MAETLAASRWPRCRRLVVPPARLCPDHPVRMKAAGVAPLGEVVRSRRCTRRPRVSARRCTSPLVELEGGARLFCHSNFFDGRMAPTEPRT